MPSTLPSAGTNRDALRYGFAVGKVRVLATRIFGRATYERLVDAPDFDEQKRILSDTAYGRYVASTETAAQVEAALEDALDANYAFLEESSLPDAVVRFVRERHDFTNLKSVLKARVLGTPLEGSISSLGTLAPERFEGDLEALPEPFGGVASEVLASVADGSRDAGEIAHAVDQAMFARLGELARASGSDPLQRVAATMVDIANIKTLARSRHADIDRDVAGAMMFEGGTVQPARLLALYELPPEDLAAGLSTLVSGDLAPICEAECFGDLGRLDVMVDDAFSRALQPARLVAAGAEPVIAYAFAREIEVAALRTVLIGKLSGVSEQTLRSRLRELYG